MRKSPKGKIRVILFHQSRLRSGAGNKKPTHAYIPLRTGSDSMSRLNGMSNRGMGNKIRDFIGKTIYQVQCEAIVR